MDVLATDRRTALRALGLVAASALTRPEIIMRAAVSAVMAADHLLLGVADLDRGIQWVEERTGVRPVVGGSHPGRGTRNALLSLGAKQYLEVIAPDPAQSTYTFQIDLRALNEPRLVTWAAATSDIDGVARGAKAAGQAVFGPSDGSRARPDGRVLKWRSLGVASSLAVGVVEPDPVLHPMGGRCRASGDRFPGRVPAEGAAHRSSPAGGGRRRPQGRRDRC